MTATRRARRRAVVLYTDRGLKRPRQTRGGANGAARQNYEPGASWVFFRGQIVEKVFRVAFRLAFAAGYQE
jgi:hypothetical protein